MTFDSCTLLQACPKPEACSAMPRASHSGESIRLVPIQPPTLYSQELVSSPTSSGLDFEHHGHSHGGVGVHPCDTWGTGTHTHHQALKTFNEPAVQIGFFASFMFLTNNIIGPGALALPFVFQTAGWMTSTLVIVLLAAASGLCATLFLQVRARCHKGVRVRPMICCRW